MKYYLIISEEKKLVTVTPEGKYRIQDVIELVNIVVNDPHYDPHFNFIIDMTKLIYTPVISEIFQISEFIVSIKKSFIGKTAMITDNDILFNLFKLSTMFVSKHGLKSRMFLNSDDVLTWLNESE